LNKVEVVWNFGVTVGFSTLAWYWDYSCSISVIRDTLPAQWKGPIAESKRNREFSCLWAAHTAD